MMVCILFIVTFHFEVFSSLEKATEQYSFLGTLYLDSLKVNVIAQLYGYQNQTCRIFAVKPVSYRFHILKPLLKAKGSTLQRT